jgi:hypothetical protein
VSQELEGADPGAAGAAVDRVGDVVRDLLAAAHADGGTPLEAAHRRAASRLAPAGVR